MYVQVYVISYPCMEFLCIFACFWFTDALKMFRRLWYHNVSPALFNVFLYAEEESLINLVALFVRDGQYICSIYNYIKNQMTHYNPEDFFLLWAILTSYPVIKSWRVPSTDCGFQERNQRGCD